MTQHAVSVQQVVGSLTEWDVFVNGERAGTVNNTVGVPESPGLPDEQWGAVDYSLQPLAETKTRGQAATLIALNYIDNPPS